MLKDKNKKKVLKSKKIIDVVVKTSKKKNVKKGVSNQKSKIIVANWKMNPVNLKEANKIFSTLKKDNFKKGSHKIIICPPSIYLSDLSSKYKGNKFIFGAQNVSWAQNHESTGEISPEMLKNLSVEYVIIGHSERRKIGETNQIIAKKINNAVENGLKVVLCVGEEVRDIGGEYLHFIQRQLIESLEGFNKKFVNNLFVAYEPVWTIGQGNEAINSHELHQINLFIKKILVNIFDRKIGLAMPILYGGSVDDENAKELIESGEVSGLLIGRASLNPYVFLKILKNITN
jgi:triosephosphate isomerase